MSNTEQFLHPTHCFPYILLSELFKVWKVAYLYQSRNQIYRCHVCLLKLSKRNPHLTKHPFPQKCNFVYFLDSEKLRVPELTSETPTSILVKIIPPGLPNGDILSYQVQRRRANQQLAGTDTQLKILEKSVS